LINALRATDRIVYNCSRIQSTDNWELVGISRLVVSRSSTEFAYVVSVNVKELSIAVGLSRVSPKPKI